MASDPIRASRSQRMAALLQRPLQRWRPWLISLSAGYLLGRVVNATSDGSATNISGLFADLFSEPSHIPNVFSWCAVLLPVVLFLLGLFITHQKRRGRPEALLASLAHRRIEAILAPFGRETLAWGPDLTLQLSPDLQGGWPVEEVQIVYDGATFTMAAEERTRYAGYVERHSDRFAQDGTKYMLLRNPVAFSDAPKLTLEVQKTKFSVVRYYQESVITLKSKRDAFLKKALGDGEITFPGSLCMHAVVITRDRHILATRRSLKVEYSPGTWSLSVEEQISPDDFRPGVNGVVKRWAQRLLLEELAVQPTDYDFKSLRLLSVFLEADIMNCSVAAVLPLNLYRRELGAILETMPRTDYEFTEWRFFSYTELARELRKPTLLHHPSTGYRILLALANRYGAARVAEVLFPGSQGT